MRELVSTLILTLEKEEEIYNEVLGLAKEKKSVLVDGKMKELEEITKRAELCCLLNKGRRSKRKNSSTTS